MRPENRGDGSGSNGSYFLRRKEEKYELHVGKAAFLRAKIERRLPIFEFRKGNRHTYITTVYFDNEELDFYQRAKNHYDDNTKIRVKEYYYQNLAGVLSSGAVSSGAVSSGAASNGAVSSGAPGATSAPGSNGSTPPDAHWLTFDYCFVEIKQRIHGLVVKRRFELPKRLLSRLLQGEDVWDELVASRSGIEFNGFVDVYREFRWYVQHYQVYPKSIINYRRSVYQQDEQELRITFDDEIAVFQPKMRLYDEVGTLARPLLGPPRKVWDTVILEIKSQNGYPEWLDEELESVLPKRLSKFTSSLKVLTQELPRPALEDAMKDTHLQAAPAPNGDTTRVSEIKL
jgi:SPX domain protein involved in polyphosphate accumulation